jgi:hypothetical protein
MDRRWTNLDGRQTNPDGGLTNARKRGQRTDNSRGRKVQQTGIGIKRQETAMASQKSGAFFTNSNLTSRRVQFGFYCVKRLEKGLFAAHCNFCSIRAISESEVVISRGRSFLYSLYYQNLPTV